jgi:SHS2 domain-containing protein
MQPAAGQPPEPPGDAFLGPDAGYFPHDADIGIIGRGRTVEDAFVNAARAMVAISCDPAAVRQLQTIDLEFREDDLEMALVTWLNLLLAEARWRGLALSGFTLKRCDGVWHGTAAGEPWRPELERGVEVKGATLTMLSVRHLDGRWEARCVVDV